MFSNPRLMPFFFFFSQTLGPNCLGTQKQPTTPYQEETHFFAIISDRLIKSLEITTGTFRVNSLNVKLANFWMSVTRALCA
jgi:hypothetical protein